MTGNGIRLPFWRLALAVLAVLLLAWLGYWHLRPAPAEPAATVAEQPPPLHLPPPRAARPLAANAPRAGRPAANPKPEAAADAQPGEETVPIDAGEISLTQLPRGDGGGLDAFPRPGTKPVLRGIVVPDGFDLPQGYVRHVQVTDDGRELPPILMFHPDYHPPGVEIPKDRVVPENLAPPGMAIEWLDPPPQEHKDE